MDHRTRTTLGPIRALVVGASCALALGAPAVDARPLSEPELVAPEVVDGAVLVRSVRVEGDTATVRLENKTRKEVRDIRLLVEHTFQWRDEFRPGAESPGYSETFQIPEAIPPGQTATVVLRSGESRPSREDGSFQTNVRVLGFTQVG